VSSLVLVTGASGVLGSKTLAGLRRGGWRVRALAHRRSVEGADELAWGSLTDAQSLAAATEGAAVVLHLAAITHSRRASAYEEINVAGTRSLLRAAARSGVERFVYVSTRAIGPGGGAYSRSKADAERLVQESGLDATVVRLPEVYGGGGKEGLDRIMELARAGRPIPLVGDGAELVCPIHIDDAVAALVAALPRGVSSGKTYVLAGECVPLDEFVRTCAEAFSTTSRQLHVPVPLVAVLAQLSRFLPLPLYPDQLARLRSAKPPPTPEAGAELGFHPRPLRKGVASCAPQNGLRRELEPAADSSGDRRADRGA
jgi:NADH dehydrogenase